MLNVNLSAILDEDRLRIAFDFYDSVIPLYKLGS